MLAACLRSRVVISDAIAFSALCLFSGKLRTRFSMIYECRVDNTARWRPRMLAQQGRA